MGVGGAESTKKSFLDIIFSFVLAVNNICVILSFVEFLKLCYTMIHKAQFTVKGLGLIVISLYPILFIMFVCKGDFSIVVQYFLSPIKILF